MAMRNATCKRSAGRRCEGRSTSSQEEISSAPKSNEIKRVPAWQPRAHQDQCAPPSATHQPRNVLLTMLLSGWNRHSMAENYE